MHFHIFHPTVSSLNIIYITAYYSHSPLPQTHLRRNPGESVIFQPVLQAYPTRHSWIITAHISLGNLEHHWKLFSRQLTRTQQFLRSLDHHPSAPTQLLTTLQLELSNIQDIYKSSKTTITSAIQPTELQPITDQSTMQKKPTTLSRRCPQLAHRNCHH